MSDIREKILLLLFSGIAFGYSYTIHRQWRIIEGVAQEWKKIEKRKLQEEIRKLYRTKILEIKENPDKSYTIVLTQKGKIKALTYHFQNMIIKRENWDGKWRIVIFDIPEKIKKARDALREKLKELGFYELQKSVFVFPYECRDEIEFIIEFFNLRKYVRIGILESVDNELHLKKIFKLI
jgi:DNA-binding transcriptional regulator PaaX